jgi:ubiquitin carboxyl-terminal hydrolase 7
MESDMFHFDHDGSLELTFLFQKSSSVATTAPRRFGTVEQKVDLVSGLVTSPVPYVGLRNQGATCCMNSVLQSLFHIPLFRRMIFQIPVDTLTPLSADLKHLFVAMEREKEAVNPYQFTRHFDWIGNVFTQNNIQRFIRVLLNTLQAGLKNTRERGTIADLFRGKSQLSITCKTVDYSTSRTEEFYDLSVFVKRYSRLEDSLMDYVKSDLLVGGNQYATPDFGPQEAVRCTRFSKFPKVLHLHLRRFEFDLVTRQSTKINSYFRFSTTLDIAPYLAPVNEHQGSIEYDLFSVLVHTGVSSSGHYTAFLRPTPAHQWYRFNDSFVSESSEDAAVARNAGGHDDRLPEWNG